MFLYTKNWVSKIHFFNVWFTWTNIAPSQLFLVFHPSILKPSFYLSFAQPKSCRQFNAFRCGQISFSRLRNKEFEFFFKWLATFIQIHRLIKTHFLLTNEICINMSFKLLYLGFFKFTFLPLIFESFLKSSQLRITEYSSSFPSTAMS